ncbi:ParM/StbA family protein [Fonticella tunisiensis]|uniref:Plasmid segregation actin-type ATPase ParM n=1 Tax=Fonticella tunisiensis TaxID=1096341 RepID=A0A4R7KTT5_9CLOT|nr:ParM/StbA family protein [Fonticella tunisiensis]TDT63443.1 plasmid segregation actin-type ATPase ParM [Fonticella tunisiensis]
MIIGVDAGYYATKTSEGIIFPSRITTQESIIGDGCSIMIGGKKYTVGEGEVTVELNKINQELTKVCILYALAKSSDDSEFSIVTGLPVGQYSKQKDALKNMLLSSRFNDVQIGNQKRLILIRDAEIFPQGAGALFSTNIEGEAVLVDIGGRTVDICLFEMVNGKRKLTKYSTILEGTLSLYSKVVHLINSKYETGLKLEDGEKILKSGLEIYGEKQDLSFLKPVIEEHTEAIFKELTLNYPIKTTNVALAGGGAYLLQGIFQKRIPSSRLIPDAQFANANGFRKVGESLWQRF